MAQFTQKTVDFGGNDPTLKPEELTAAKTAGGSTSVQVPTVLGAITISYNVSGVETGLKLDGATIADIFSGKITKWNDPKIAVAELGREPSEHRHHDVPPVGLVGYDEELHDLRRDLRLDLGEEDRRRQDGQVARRHRCQGQRRRRGLRQAERRRGRLRREAYALQNKFNTAAVKNKSGAYIEPTLASTSAAGDGVEVAADNTFSPLDSPNPAAYPITSTTYMLLWQDACKAGQSKETATDGQTFASFALGEGQSIAQQLYYAPLPDAIKTQAQKSVDGLQCNGSAL